MTTDIQQQLANEIYDTTQQHIKAMSQMWSLDNYHGSQQYPITGKEDNLTPIKSENMMFHPFFAHQLYPQNFSQLTPTPSSESPQPSKKKPQPVPEEQKDESYRERRRRNNEAARKSREAKRKHEEISSIRLASAQSENVKLHHEIYRLNMEVERLRSILAHLSTQQSMMVSTNNTDAHSLPPPSY